MSDFAPQILQTLYKPAASSHKGENGKLLLIGGSKLFHAASLWSLQVASKVVDMVFYASVPENNQLVQNAKEEFRNGIVIPRTKIDDYINEADCILIGPGLPREEGIEEGDDDTKIMTENLLSKYPNKKWVIDGGSLQVVDPKILPKKAIITPHKGEFKTLFRVEASAENVQKMAEKFDIVILLKGEYDFVCSKEQAVKIEGGNSGMTKGGTGDVLAGLVAAFYCKNEALASAISASYINKRAGEELFKKVGPYFNASDLANEIPIVMKELIL